VLSIERAVLEPLPLVELLLPLVELLLPLVELLPPLVELLPVLVELLPTLVALPLVPGVLFEVLVLVLLSTAAVPVEVEPDVPPQPASATVRLPNTDQASRPPPKLRLASFMRPLDQDFVAGRTGRSHQLTGMRRGTAKPEG
jgi:hypothetical protein